MEIGLAILLFVCMTALLYVVLSLKIAKQVDLQIKEFYKTRIHSDMQEFYREMEGYAALFENRIQRFRVLVERNEAVVREYDTPAVAPVTEAIPENFEPKKQLKAKRVMAGREPVKSKQPLKKPEVKKPASARQAPQVATGKQSAKLVPVTVRQTPPQRIPAVAIRTEAPLPDAESDDSTIAEELMKDLFVQDEVALSSRSSKPPPAQQKAEERAESPGMAKSFSRLGKAIEPVLFGDKAQPAVPTKEELKPIPVPHDAPAKDVAPSLQKSTSDFSEVLRRAEQIKVEKKAERERAEVEARAEFYAGGDSFKREEPRRNALAVKELDRHTINFLIDSLVKDNGYRKQALRALTENNIPLDEIARLSKIDIGELELMRQLGRF